MISLKVEYIKIKSFLVINIKYKSIVLSIVIHVKAVDGVSCFLRYNLKYLFKKRVTNFYFIERIKKYMLLSRTPNSYNPLSFYFSIHSSSIVVSPIAYFRLPDNNSILNPPGVAAYLLWKNTIIISEDELEDLVEFINTERLIPSIANKYLTTVLKYDPTSTKFRNIHIDEVERYKEAIRSGTFESTTI